MNPQTSIDYMIIGQGVGGTCLALQLIKEGDSVLVIDEAEKNISSIIAAGLYNPITGRKWVKTWMADQLFPFAESFYSEFENELKTRFLIKTPIYRPFPDLEYQNEWMGKSTDPNFQPFISSVATESIEEDLNDPYGGIHLKQSGRLDLPQFLISARSYIVEKGALLNTKFEFSELKKVDDEYVYDQYRIKNVIFSEGPAVTDNKLWNWLPFSPVKGELLEIEIDKPFRNEIIPNRGVFMIPITQNRLKVGATYEFKSLDTSTTQKAQDQIIERLGNLFTGNYVIKTQLAGIRPATKDRRPFLGEHPELSNVYIFNGLGTKGVTLAPYFANMLLQHIKNGKHLIREVDIERFL